MQIKLWGVRGSLPSPLSNNEYKNKIEKILKIAAEQKIQTDTISSFMDSLSDELKFTFGGDTTCATVQSASGKTYIIDCGTGIRRLGDDLMEGDCGKGKGILDIFLTHNHWDHIQGLPFFRPIYVPGNIINFYSPFKHQQQTLENQMKAPYFPAKFEDSPSVKKYHYIEPIPGNTVQLEPDLHISIFPMKHPQGCFAYKFSQGKKTFIFATDTEFTGETIENRSDTRDFFNNADLLVLDSQYTLAEAFLKVDWGHTSYTMAVNCATNWNVKKLVMTHHEPAYSDDTLYENYLLALEHARLLNNDKTKIYLAREGMVFDL